jgi:hypothetical protein
MITIGSFPMCVPLLPEGNDGSSMLKLTLEQAMSIYWKITELKIDSFNAQCFGSFKEPTGSYNPDGSPIWDADISLTSSYNYTPAGPGSIQRDTSKLICESISGFINAGVSYGLGYPSIPGFNKNTVEDTRWQAVADYQASHPPYYYGEHAVEGAGGSLIIGTGAYSYYPGYNYFYTLPLYQDGANNYYLEPPDFVFTIGHSYGLLYIYFTGQICDENGENCYEDSGFDEAYFTHNISATFTLSPGDPDSGVVAAGTFTFNTPYGSITKPIYAYPSGYTTYFTPITFSNLSGNLEITIE